MKAQHGKAAPLVNLGCDPGRDPSAAFVECTERRHDFGRRVHIPKNHNRELPFRACLLDRRVERLRHLTRDLAFDHVIVDECLARDVARETSTRSESFEPRAKLNDASRLSIRLAHLVRFGSSVVAVRVHVGRNTYAEERAPGRVRDRDSTMGPRLRYDARRFAQERLARDSPRGFLGDARPVGSFRHVCPV